MKDEIKSHTFWKDKYKNMLLKDVNLSANMLMPRWHISSTNELKMNGDEMICHIQYIMDGLRDVYYMGACLWNDSNSFDKLITSVCTSFDAFIHNTYGIVQLKLNFKGT